VAEVEAVEPVFGDDGQAAEAVGLLTTCPAETIANFASRGKVVLRLNLFYSLGLHRGSGDFATPSRSWK